MTRLADHGQRLVGPKVAVTRAASPDDVKNGGRRDINILRDLSDKTQPTVSAEMRLSRRRGLVN